MYVLICMFLYCAVCISCPQLAMHSTICYALQCAAIEVGHVSSSSAATASNRYGALAGAYHTVSVVYVNRYGAQACAYHIIRYAACHARQHLQCMSYHAVSVVYAILPHEVRAICKYVECVP